MDLTLLKEAIKDIANNHNLTEKAVIAALENAIQIAYKKEIKTPDAEIKVDLDFEKGFVTVAQLKLVTPDEKITDDALEIDYDDAKEDADLFLENLEDEKKEAEERLANANSLKKSPKKAALLKEINFRLAEIENLSLKVKEAKENIRFGGKYPLYCDIDNLSQIIIKIISSNFRTQIAEAEREALYDVYKDHIGEMETGIVEKADDRAVVIRLRHGVTELSRRELIGDETFKPGDQIKVYIEEVKPTSDPNKPSKGPQVQATRSSEGFLKRIFEEEIREIYDGTIFIKGIAREAGTRSKVAVMSKDDAIDPTGACIGPQGSRIAKVIDQLGHNSSEKEKIDIISYSPYLPLYVADALRPADVMGVYLVHEEGKKYPDAYVVVNEEQIHKAYGKKRSNLKLASRLTGTHIILLTPKEAQEKGISWVGIEELKRLASEEKLRQEMAEYAEKSRQDAARRAKLMENKKEEAKEMILPEVSDEEEEELEEISTYSPKMEEEVTSVEETPLEEKKEEVIKEEETSSKATLQVKTTTTLEDLEKELATPTKKERDDRKKGSKKRPHHISEEEIAHAKPSEGIIPAMPIYSQEELEEIEKEEAELEEDDSFDEDFDYEDYDQYYDEN